MNSFKQLQPKYILGRITSKYLILEILFCSFFRQKGFAYLHQTSKSLRQLLRENFVAALNLSEDVLEHIQELPFTISKVELPDIGNDVHLLLVSGDRLYTEADKTLYVYSLSDLTSPIATYDISGVCFSGLIADNRLFIAFSDRKSYQYFMQIIICEISTSLTEPLKLLENIKTSQQIKKMIKVGQELFLGAKFGHLQVFDI